MKDTYKSSAMSKEEMATKAKSFSDDSLQNERQQWSIILYFIKNNPWVKTWLWDHGFNKILTFGEYTFDPHNAVFKEGVRLGYFVTEQFFNENNILTIIKAIDDEQKARAEAKKSNKPKKERTTKKKN